MPIKPEMRGFYSRDWREVSRTVRFVRAAGVCQSCGRPHGTKIRCLPDGRWFDAARGTWRNGRGRPTRWPDLIETAQIRYTRVILAAAHLDHDPRNNRLRNLKSLCQRCHIMHDRPYHLVQRRITYLLRRALGDLFLGPYSAYSAVQTFQVLARRPVVTAFQTGATDRELAAFERRVGLARAALLGPVVARPSSANRSRRPIVGRVQPVFRPAIPGFWG